MFLFARRLDDVSKKDTGIDNGSRHKITEFLEQARREQVEANDAIGQFSTKQKQSG